MRYLTRRFIGEYRSNTDLLYRQTVTLDSGLLDIEIVDISAENDEFPSEQLQWADACLIVYSITDRSSYEYASRSLGEMRQLQSTPIAYLVGNKADLDHLRQVCLAFLYFDLSFSVFNTRHPRILGVIRTYSKLSSSFASLSLKPTPGRITNYARYHFMMSINRCINFPLYDVTEPYLLFDSPE